MFHVRVFGRELTGDQDFGPGISQLRAGKVLDAVDTCRD